MTNERIHRQINRLLDGAEEAFAQRNGEVVRDNAEDVIGLDPENQEALAFLSAAERALGGSSPSSATLLSTAPTTTTDEPTSFANGRYEVKRFLGEGGKKRVYLACHPRRPIQDVALSGVP